MHCILQDEYQSSLVCFWIFNILKTFLLVRKYFNFVSVLFSSYFQCKEQAYIIYNILTFRFCKISKILVSFIQKMYLKELCFIQFTFLICFHNFWVLLVQSKLNNIKTTDKTKSKRPDDCNGQKWLSVNA